MPSLLNEIHSAYERLAVQPIHYKLSILCLAEGTFVSVSMNYDVQLSKTILSIILKAAEILALTRPLAAALTFCVEFLQFEEVGDHYYARKQADVL